MCRLQDGGRCTSRAVPWPRGSNSASPPSLGRAPILPDSSISNSGPRDLEFEYPVVVFKIERARYKIDTRGESSTTKACSTMVGVVLLSLHGSAAGHARFDRSKNSTFSAPSELLAATRTGGSQATLASYQPCAVIKSLSVLHLQPRRACAARCSQRGPEGPSRKLRSGC